MNILVVDDEFVSRTKLQTLLSKRGQCDAAENGTEAIQAMTQAYRSGEPYDLVTMDIDMPDMTGQDVLQHIRQWERDNPLAEGHEIKFLMITAMRDPHDVMSSFSSGAEWYLHKPVTPDALDEAIGKIDFLLFANRPPAKAPAASDPSAGSSRNEPQPTDDCRLTLPESTRINLERLEEEFLGEYLDSTRVKLVDLEADALSLDDGGEAEDLENAIMRNLHSLKGEAGMIGLLDVQAVCHETESFVKDHAGCEDIPDTVLAVKDWLESVVQYLSDPTPQPVASACESDSSDAPPHASAGPALPEVLSIHLDDVKADFLADYLQSTSEKLDTLEAHALELEAGCDEDRLCRQIVEMLNTLKGEGAMIGLAGVMNTLQEIETCFLKCSHKPNCAGMILDVKDWLGSLLARLASLPQTA
jgi:two-component system, chemotaxis family, chemotaxis protein CheY